MVKVSVIMPSLNVAPYIRQCIDSVVHQTLREIEIICVDAGSTDGTQEILREYAEKDSRIQVILSDQKSYGYQMNLGLDAAAGEYIGILETDDWAEPDMFEKLWTAAVENSADVVKSNYYWYTTGDGEKNKPFENLAKCTYGTVFSPEERTEIFAVTPSIWSGIYRKEMLVSRGIRFNETPGASFQDTSFHFMVCAAAQRYYLLKDHCLHYRRDNEGSSVHSKAKVFCVADEMHWFETFLEAHPDKKQKLGKLLQALKYEKYRWNYERLDAQEQYAFLKLMYKEFREAEEAGLLDKRYFGNTDWTNLNQILSDMGHYYRETQLFRYAKTGVPPQATPVTVCRGTCEDPLVTVVVPVFNTAPYLEECLQSIVGQTLQNIEIICVDDGSTDGSRQIIDRFAASDERISVIDMGVNAGQSAARNTAMDIARGKYLYFIDSDDYIVPEALETLYETAEKWETDIIYFGGDSFYESKELAIQHPTYTDLYHRKPAFQEPVAGDVFLLDQMKAVTFRCSVPLQLIRKEYLKGTGIRFKQGFIHEDELFSCITTAKAERVLCIEDSLYRRRVRDRSTITKGHTAVRYVSMLAVTSTLAAHILTDETLSAAAVEAITLQANKTQKNARRIGVRCPPVEKAKIDRLVPLQYRYFRDNGSVEKKVPAVEDITKSLSFRIGSAITFLPRKIRGFVWCCRESGLKYTLNLLLQKLGLKR